MQDSNDSEAEAGWGAEPVDAARQAVWRLFENGLIDENAATDALLAVDVGIRRMRHPRTGADPPDHAQGG